MKVPGCKTVLHVVLTDERTVHERLFTYMPIDAYRLRERDLPLLDGATKVYYNDQANHWYIHGPSKSSPLKGWANDYEPYALEASSCYKLVVYLASDVIPYQIYNSIVDILLTGLNREVWFVDHHPVGQEEHYSLFKIELIDPLTSSFITFTPLVESERERVVSGKPIEQDIALSLHRTHPAVS
jgi:hypothetical protein